MLGNNLHEHEADKRVRWYLVNRKVVLNLIYLVVCCQVSTSLKFFYQTLHATAGTTLGSTQRSTVNDEYALVFCINFVFALAVVDIANCVDCLGVHPNAKQIAYI